MPTFRFLSLFCSLLASTASANFPHHRGDGTRLWEQTGTNALHVWIGDNYEERDGKVLFHVVADGHRVCTFEPAAGGITGYNATNQEFYFYHPDYLGSSSLMTERNGTQVQHYEYSAFGQSRFTQSSTAFHVSKRYTGQVLDEDTGLYYYNFRYYIPELARFGQPDDVIPDLGDPQSWNRYSYVRNNPLRLTDQSGYASDDDDFDVPTTLGAAHALLRQSAGAASARLYNNAIANAQTDAAIGRAAAELNPVVGGVNAGYQAATGKDAIDYHGLGFRFELRGTE